MICLRPSCQCPAARAAWLERVKARSFIHAACAKPDRYDDPDEDPDLITTCPVGGWVTKIGACTDTCDRLVDAFIAGGGK